MSQKLKWMFDVNNQTFSVDPNCEDYGKYGMLSFALTRYKDIMSHEEFLTVQSLYNGADNGKYYMTVKDFEDLFDDREVSPLTIRKVLLEKGYIEGSNGRTVILKKLDKKPVRVVAFKDNKFPV